MSQTVLLDSGPLGQICHHDPSRHAEIKRWFDLLLAGGVAVFIPAIADFEVRRSLILAKRTRSLARLDALQARAELPQAHDSRQAQVLQHRPEFRR